MYACIDPGVKGGIAGVGRVKDNKVMVWASKLEETTIDLSFQLHNSPTKLQEVFVEDNSNAVMMDRKNTGKLIVALKLRDHFQRIITTLECLKIKHSLLHPAKWQKIVPGLPKDYNNRKRALRDKAVKVFPGLHPKPTLATADALMMLYYICKYKGVA